MVKFAINQSNIGCFMHMQVCMYLAVLPSVSPVWQNVLRRVKTLRKSLLAGRPVGTSGSLL